MLSPTRRLNVFTRDSHTCMYCGAMGVALEVDHVTPQFWGGSDDYDNLVSACARCNNEKSAMNLNTYMMFLRERDGVDTVAIRTRVLNALRRKIK